jgi:hypothetical protein
MLPFTERDPLDGGGDERPADTDPHHVTPVPHKLQGDTRVTSGVRRPRRHPTPTLTPTPEDPAAAIEACLEEIHQHLGGELETLVYKRALEVELRRRNLSFEREPVVPVSYKDVCVGRQRVAFTFGTLALMFAGSGTVREADVRAARLAAVAMDIPILLVAFGTPRLDVRLFWPPRDP